MEEMTNDLSVYQLLRQAAERKPKKEAIYDLKDRRTFAQLLNDVDHLANVLKEKKINRGDRIAVSLPNWYETILLVFASSKIGSILVPFNPLYQEDEVIHILEDAKPKLLFITDRLGTESLKKFTNHTGEVIIVRGYVSGFTSFEDLKSQNDLLVYEVEIDINNDIYCILYTSGTTGKPKGVMITHRSVVQSGMTISKLLRCDRHDVYITAAPIFHIFGMACNLFAAVARCSKTVLIERYEPELMLEMIEQEKVTIHQGVPTMFLKELEVENFDKYDLSSLRTGIVGAAPITPEQMREIRSRFGMNLCQSYGITETGSVTMTPYDDEEKNILTSLGLPIPGVKIKIVNEEREEVATNEVGEIAIHSFGTMQGYYNLENETKKVLDDEGWFYTGDLARKDENGYLYFIGREKEMIIRSGFNIYPQEIEEVLVQHPLITEAAVIGLPDDILGEQVCAVIKCQDKKIDKDEVLKFVSDRVSVYKVPQEVVVVDDYPMTPSGKIQKNELRREILQKIN